MIFYFDYLPEFYLMVPSSKIKHVLRYKQIFPYRIQEKAGMVHQKFLLLFVLGVKLPPGKHKYLEIGLHQQKVYFM